MKSFSTTFFKIFSFIFLFSFHYVYSNNPVYEQRRTDYVNTALTNFSPDALTLQAYAGVPLDTNVLNAMLANVTSGETSDFTIVKLIRILFFTNGTYDNKILPVLNHVPFWLTKSDTIRNYWSENHMIMWMSSDWLLHEKYGKPIDANLDARLRHYLRLKLQYGFYEFFSSVYSPYSLSGLLNLADFAQDVEIKTLAAQASQRLLKNILMLTNDKGVFFPTAGRNYYGKYKIPYAQNHNNLIYLLTGMGAQPLQASHAGGFLASSSLSVDTVIFSWSPSIDTLFYNGHSLDTGFSINASMSPLDKVIFQWSSGAYFHPDVVLETVQLLRDSNLWHHTDFTLLRPLSIIAPEDFPATSESLSCISKSSVICGEEVAIYKQNSVTLSSVQDFWKGKVGFQQFPCVANVGTTAVMTASGEVKYDWESRSDNNANEHLPYVKQKKNMALLMYRPEPTPPLLGFTHKQVALFWKNSDFDEVLADSLWLLGRQENSYVAVRRSCIGEIDSVIACETGGGQTWVIIVGDSSLYGSFNNFQNVVHQSRFEERWYYDSLTSESVYYSKISIDTITIEYAWGVDTSSLTGIEKAKENLNDFRISPNPTKDYITVELTPFLNQDIKLTVTNVLGQQLYKKEFKSSLEESVFLDLKNLSDDLYLISIETPTERFVKKIVKD